MGMVWRRRPKDLLPVPCQWVRARGAASGVASATSLFLRPTPRRGPSAVRQVFPHGVACVRMRSMFAPLQRESLLSGDALLFNRRPFYLIAAAACLLFGLMFYVLMPKVTPEQRVKEQLSLLRRE